MSPQNPLDLRKIGGLHQMMVKAGLTRALAIRFESISSHGDEQYACIHPSATFTPSNRMTLPFCRAGSWLRFCV
jgi:hypothetical protein